MEELNHKFKEEIMELQGLDQKLQELAMQKYTLQTQLLEVENAILELKDSEEAYKIIGGIIVSTDKKKLENDLNSKIEILNVKITSLTKREETFKKRAEDIQKKIMSLKK